MPREPDAAATRVLRNVAHPLHGTPRDFDELLALVGDAHVVLLGEGSHGTHEFYRIRAEITKRLIREHGFGAVAVEADWPDAYRVNRYVRGRPDDRDATEALAGFARFPQWMWRNADVLDFVGWLREFNDGRATEADKVGFYGLDLYSLHRSMAAVIAYLRIVDPAGAERAERRYACFDHFGDDPQVYGYATAMDLAPSCEHAVLQQLVDLRREAAEYARRDGRVAADDLFFAAQNAKVVASAERYYRTMFAGGHASWNLRDRHMADVLDSLLRFVADQRGTPRSRIVVWAHNSHLGDARATSPGHEGQLNLGQLVREEMGADAVLVGFTTYDGHVSAASDWDGPVQRMAVRPVLEGSYEALFHDVGAGNFWVDLRAGGESARRLEAPRLERAIGVIYRPSTERMSHYFHASLPHQFDAVLHYDHTRAVEPLERSATWVLGEHEAPETWPSAL